MTIKIAVTGTHSTGKTTFVTAVSSALQKCAIRVTVVSDLGEEAMNLGFPILYNHVPESTLWIMTAGISRELVAGLDADVVLVDRPVPDALGYYRAALAYRGDAAPGRWASYLLALSGHHAQTYDLIFSAQLDPSIPLGTNKPRDPDGRFRAMAAQGITDVLNELGIPGEPLTPHNHEAAVQRVLDYVLSRRPAVPAQASPIQNLADA
ncbi:AAA family ATPase [Catellatospora sp. NPDC049111]|uniref:AAA family ATPase n=1 Tax=Catellatospora sp. NPDC049111 TaxID=3155271 RepID=UPI0034106AAF